jgi:putative membrane protein
VGAGSHELLSAADHERLRNAVTAAESQTSGEVVVVVCPETTHLPLVQPLVIVIGLLLIMSSEFGRVLYGQFLDGRMATLGAAGQVAQGSWGTAQGVGFAWGLLPLLVDAVGAVLVGLGIVMGSKRLRPLRGWLTRLLVPPTTLNASVEERALLEFYQRGLEKTDGSTGVLLLVSLAEHAAVVLADKGIAAKLPASTWDEIIAALLAQARKGELVHGIEVAVGSIGGVLSTHFPRAEGDRNELPDDIVLSRGRA